MSKESKELRAALRRRLHALKRPKSIVISNGFMSDGLRERQQWAERLVAAALGPLAWCPTAFCVLPAEHALGDHSAAPNTSRRDAMNASTSDRR